MTGKPAKKPMYSSSRAGERLRAAPFSPLVGWCVAPSLAYFAPRPLYEEWKRGLPPHLVLARQEVNVEHYDEDEGFGRSIWVFEWVVWYAGGIPEPTAPLFLLEATELWEAWRDLQGKPKGTYERGGNGWRVWMRPNEAGGTTMALEIDFS